MTTFLQLKVLGAFDLRAAKPGTSRKPPSSDAYCEVT
eukprot:SAG31_NODE_47265_length_251_cov_0.671053_1_plen_36_part_10